MGLLRSLDYSTYHDCGVGRRSFFYMPRSEMDAPSIEIPGLDPCYVEGTLEA